MKTTRKIWIGVGAFVVVGAGSGGAVLPGLAQPLSATHAHPPTPGGVASSPAPSGHIILTQQHASGEAGEAGAFANLPPDLAFAMVITLTRGHLLVGDELVKQKQWAAALPHFLHPTEELYGTIRGVVANYKTPPFENALLALANSVKAKNGGADYARTRTAVNAALAAADAGLREKQDANWASFRLETSVEAIKTASEEYSQAIVNGRIVKPVEYQDARGFIWQAELMIENVAADLEKKDAASLKQLRGALAELKKAFPAAMPPKVPVKDLTALLADIGRIEAAAGRLM